MRHLPEEAVAIAGGGAGSGGKLGDRATVAGGPAQGWELLRLGQGGRLRQLRIDPRAGINILKTSARDVESGGLGAALDEEARLEVPGGTARGRLAPDDGPLVLRLALGGRSRGRQDLLSRLRNPHEQHGRVAQVRDAPVEVGKHLRQRAAEDVRQRVFAQRIGDVGRDQQDAVARGERERRELGLARFEAVHRLGVLVVGLVNGECVPGGVEDARRPSRCQHDAVALPGETPESQSHAMLRHAARVPVQQGALGLAVDGDERAREAQVERFPGALRLRDEVAGVLMGGRRRPLRQREQLAALRPGPVPLGDANGGPTLLGLVGDDRELADLQGVVHGCLPQRALPARQDARSPGRASRLGTAQCSAAGLYDAPTPARRPGMRLRP